MKRSLILLTVASYLVLALTLFDFDVPKKAEADSFKGRGLVVHEWGTFTTIAGKDGAALDWRPLSGAADLPQFVYTEASGGGFRGTYHDPGKGRLARVRMETPVIYFYPEREMEVSVEVGFPQGQITEWYPQASVVNAKFGTDKKGRMESGINWGTIKLLPGEKPDYLREVSDSHYYPARETDAAPVEVCNWDRSKIEKEKFLFYRGIGNFGLPLTVRIDGQNLILANQGAGEIENLIVFENQGGKIGYRFIESLSKETIVERPAGGGSLEKVLAELEKILIGAGLYEKEARAMLKTWQDSWFEEGLRVFYLLPTEATDRILPLKIQPQPAETIRVMVGRAEVVTPEMEREVKKQVALLKSESPETRAEAQRNLQKRGRFYEPVLKNILQSEPDARTRAEIENLISQGE